MKVVFDDEALDDLQRIFTEIVQDNPKAAGELVERIFAMAHQIANRGPASIRHESTQSDYCGPITVF